MCVICFKHVITMQKIGFCRFGGPEVDTLHEAAANEASDWLHWSVLKQLPLVNDIYHFKMPSCSTSLRGQVDSVWDFHPRGPGSIPGADQHFFDYII